SLWSPHPRAAEFSIRDTRTSIEGEAFAAFKKARYDRVVHLLETAPPGHEPSRELLRVSLLSYLRLGRPELALKTYARLVPPARPDDAQLLRELAWGFITERLRDPEEHIRITAYSGLAEIASPQAIPFLQDGLLDVSVLVRSRAVEGLGRTRRAASLPALK